MARWLQAASMSVLQLLPINEMPSQQTSPYSALSAMAIDPQFISVWLLEDFVALGGEHSLDADHRALLQRVRAAPRVDYSGVRHLKHAAFRRAFARFRETEWPRNTARAAELRAYIHQHAWWLDDYSLFRALHARENERPWWEWPTELRDHEPDALARARIDLADDVLYRQYLQWIASAQWDAARRAASGVALFGDLPFMVGGDSADVWARQDEFRLDASVGAPPDAFSASGQDWGLPVYRWDVLAERDFGWLRQRARRNAELFDGYRVDHLVGFYRTFFRPHDGGPAQFTPSDQDAQIRLGERVLAVLREPGADIIAEDLGVVPDFVRESLVRQAVPGCKVLRWERQYDDDGQPFRNPVDYPAVAVAVSGTHDTEPMVTWWDHAPAGEKWAALEIPLVRDRLSDQDRTRALAAEECPVEVRDALLEAMYASGADLLILPMQDVFGWRERINEPATTSAANWTWRLPWLSDTLSAEPEARAAAAQLSTWATRHGR